MLYYADAPDVFISQSITVWKENTPLDLLCKASGVPAVYNYTGFVQRVGAVVIPNSHAEHPGVKESISVNIPSLQLQDTGTYTCNVQNGITGVNKQLVQTASQRIDVRGRPFPATELTIKSVNDTVTLEWKKGFNGGDEQTFVLQTSLNSDGVWMNRTTILESESKHGVAESGYNAAQTYEAISMTTNTQFYDALKNGDNGANNSDMLNEASAKPLPYYGNVKKGDTTL
ncbi:hypothetical protein MAR_021047 [Mya arenaria]|uniref:Ig-like domain-containing protein n=1 Tax=Mya arenaria TaxID=6604 RepID=A0ABY7EAA8_MYAAR|nr:hypothetical protein MAR_021047 [Mya arenaria]